MIKIKAARMRSAMFVVGIVFILPTLWFGLRSYGSYQLLRSAYEAGAPDTSSIRPWMTLAYVGDAYRVSLPALLQNLALAPNTNPHTNLRSAATAAGMSRLQYVERVQRAVAAAGGGTAPAVADDSGWLGLLGDEVLSALLVYGYPALALGVFLGTVGLPLPQGLLTAAAGSLAAQGHLDGTAAGALVVAAAVAGDVADYAIGRVINRGILERHGWWLGYTRRRGPQLDELFRKWGLATVLITRTFVSYLSSIASLLAGVSRYRFSKFAAAAIAGRVIWTWAYLGLGYAIGASLDAATGFLTDLTGFFLCAIVVVLAGWLGARSRPQSALRMSG